MMAVLLLGGLRVVDYIPDNAVVYLDESKTYYSPPLLWEDSRPFYVAMSPEEVRKHGLPHVSQQPTSDQEWDDIAEEFRFVWVYNKDKTWTLFRPRDATCVLPVEKGTIKEKGEYSPDRRHVNAGGFYGKTRPLALHVLGLTKSRWNPDGSWRW